MTCWMQTMWKYKRPDWHRHPRYTDLCVLQNLRATNDESLLWLELSNRDFELWTLGKRGSRWKQTQPDFRINKFLSQFENTKLWIWVWSIIFYEFVKPFSDEAEIGKVTMMLIEDQKHNTMESKMPFLDDCSLANDNTMLRYLLLYSQSFDIQPF